LVISNHTNQISSVQNLDLEDDYDIRL
jgi:hypothetical protein